VPVLEREGRLLPDQCAISPADKQLQRPRITFTESIVNGVTMRPGIACIMTNEPKAFSCNTLRVRRFIQEQNRRGVTVTFIFVYDAYTKKNRILNRTVSHGVLRNGKHFACVHGLELLADPPSAEVQAILDIWQLFCTERLNHQIQEASRNDKTAGS
jgi:hypothetical protein